MTGQFPKARPKNRFGGLRRDLQETRREEAREERERKAREASIRLQHGIARMDIPKERQ